tara:strand:+ start:389 stop:655 length:267 start_codon:yes stop_codon:yes gene_type:complete
VVVQEQENYSNTPQLRHGDKVAVTALPVVVLPVEVVVLKLTAVLVSLVLATLVEMLLTCTPDLAVERVVQELSALPRCQPGVLVRPLP